MPYVLVTICMDMWTLCVKIQSILNFKTYNFGKVRKYKYIFMQNVDVSHVWCFLFFVFVIEGYEHLTANLACCKSIKHTCYKCMMHIVFSLSFTAIAE